MQVNVQERFFAWLSARVSPAQLSEFYIVCKDIESFCMSKRILTESLFETTSTVVIQGVIDTIKSNRMFQLKYFRQLGKMRKVMDYYMAHVLQLLHLTSAVPNMVLIGIMLLNILIAVVAVMFPARKMIKTNIIDEVRG